MTRPDPEKPIAKSDRDPADADSEESAVEAESEPAPEPWTPARALEWNAYYDIYVMLGVLLLAFFVSANKITHSSIWTQLQVGRLIAAKGGPVLTDRFSYTEFGKPWVNVPWLFEWSHALLYKAASDLSPPIPDDPGGSTAKAAQFGAGALVALNALARVLTAFLLMRIRHRGPGLWWSAFCTMLALGAFPTPTGIALGGIAGPGLVQPSTWGILFLAVELWLLHRAVTLGSRGSAFVLPLLFALWANVDESFVLGLVVLAAAAIGRVKPARGESAGAFNLGVALAVLAVSALACLANPSFHRVYPASMSPLLGWLRASTDVITTDQLSYFSREILDQGQPGRSLLVFFGVVVLIGLGSFALNARRFSLTRFLVYVVACVLWALRVRYSAEFAVIFAVTLALNGQEWYHDRLGTEGRLGLGWSFWSIGGRAVTISLVALCLAMAITSYGQGFGEPQFGFGYNPDDFAFEAADFLKTAPIEGNVLNTTITQGDALVWRAYPERKTYIDSRQQLFPPEVLNRLQDARRALSEDDVAKWKPFLDELEVSAVMIQAASAPNTYRVLMESPNWIPFHDDGNVVMFGRADASATDLAFFKSHVLEAESLAYLRPSQTPSPAGPPSPMTSIDKIFQARALAKPQPHTESSRRWLQGLRFDPTMPTLPDPARCLLAIREAHKALASKPDDTQAYRLLAEAYRSLMIQESALLAGLELTPETATQVARVTPRPDLLTSRFRQRVTALTYAIQTTPPPRNVATRRDLAMLNLELFQVFLSVNYLDLARDRLQLVLDGTEIGDFTAEVRTQFSQDLARLEEQVSQVETKMNEARAEQQVSPVQLASFAISQGAPGLAVRELEEAERTGTNPALVKPQLVDLYCDTGQPEKALELFTTGTTDDPSFGAEPGTSAMRQGRVHFLLGNDNATTLWEKYAIPRLKQDRATRALNVLTSTLRGDVQPAVSTLFDIPEKIGQQALWEFDAALSRLEGGATDIAAEHFTKALTLSPKLAFRPIAAYYLEKLGKPAPPKPIVSEASAEVVEKAKKPEEPATK